MSDPTTAPNANAPQSGTPKQTPAGIDPRGPRFGGGVTAALVAVVALLFVLGGTRGVQGTLQGLAFKAWIRPRLAPPTEVEDPRPPRFAQDVGLLVVGAFLNAAFGLCLGCELYLLQRRSAHQN